MMAARELDSLALEGGFEDLGSEGSIGTNPFWTMITGGSLPLCRQWSLLNFTLRRQYGEDLHIRSPPKALP